MRVFNHRCSNADQGWQTRLWCLSWAVLALIIGLAWPRAVLGQISGAGRGKNFVAPVTDAQGHRSVVRGADARPAGQGQYEITKMQAETYRGLEKDMIVEAPKCLFNSKSNIAKSSGPLTIHTADGRFSIEGEGFQWLLGDSRLTSKLVISNKVHSLVRKRLINPKPSASGASAATQPGSASKPSQAIVQPSTATSTNEFIEITSEAFDYQAELAVFRGHVRAHEAEGDLVCGILTVIFKADSGAVERIEAEQDVVLDQGATRARADKANYKLAPENEVVEFSGHAAWSDGERQGSGERVTFDRLKRVLRAEEKAYLKLPRAALGEAGFLTPGPKAAPRPATTGVDTNAFVEVFSDIMTIDLPATNGPVRRIVAEKSVMINDARQDGRALANRAVYEDVTGALELTGSPMIESEHRLVTGQTIRFDRATRVLTATPDAYLKLPVRSLGGLGAISKAAPNLPTNALPATNQFIEVWAKEFEYHTNLLRFRDHVRANFLEGDIPRGKLTCEAMLEIKYGERLEHLVAEKNVELEQFVLKNDPRPVSRRVACPLLRLDFSPEGRLSVATAERGVTADQEERRPDLPRPILSNLTADSVTGFFSSMTNRVEKIVADKDVVFSEDQRVARGGKAIYTETNGLVELTGEPTAVMPEGRITEAERLVWDRLRQRFSAKGRFKSEWKRPEATANQLAAPAALAK